MSDLKDKFAKAGKEAKERKYYTPKIEEFHVGFEYEYSDLDHDLKTTKWFKESVPLEFRFSYYLELLNKKDWIRVKSLDQEDIESFGFEFKGKTIDNWYSLIETHTMNMSVHKNRKFVLQHDFSDNQGIIIYGHEYENGSGDVTCLYRGKCKNKSELKKVLQQIGVVEDE